MTAVPEIGQTRDIDPREAPMPIRTNKFGTRVNVTKCALCGDEAAHPQARVENPHSWQCNECGTVFTTEGKVLE
jgi:hypothetical protein